MCEPEYLFPVILLNLPVVYTLVTEQVDARMFAFSYVLCGIFQGYINSGLYYISDIVFTGKVIDDDEWKKNRFYDNVIHNTDSTYLYALGRWRIFRVSSFPTPSGGRSYIPDIQSFSYKCYIYSFYTTFFSQQCIIRFIKSRTCESYI